MVVSQKAGSSAGPKSRRSRGRPSLKQVADIDRELRDVALNEFLKHGYGGTSMAMIVKAAGVSKTTLYSRYSSKEELFLAIINKIFETNQVVGKLTEGRASLDLEQGLKAYLRRTMEVGASSIVVGIDRLIFSESHRFPELASLARGMYQKVHENLRHFIVECAEQSGKVCPDPDSLAEAVIELARGYHLKSMVTNHKPTSAELQSWVDRTIAVLAIS